MNELFGDHLMVSMPKRSHLTKRKLKNINTSEHSFACETNLLTSNIEVI